MSDDNEILLVLDLDETLIYSSEYELHRRPDFHYDRFFIYMRPSLNWFLLKVYENFDVGIWSSADELYVDYIINRITPKSLKYKIVWGRNHCSVKRDFETDSYIYLKQLKRLKRKGFNLDKVIIVDDSKEKSRENYGNSIYIKPYMGEIEDDKLLFLERYLERLKYVKSVRKIEKRGWRASVKL